MSYQGLPFFIYNTVSRRGSLFFKESSLIFPNLYLAELHALLITPFLFVLVVCFVGLDLQETDDLSLLCVDSYCTRRFFRV